MGCHQGAKCKQSDVSDVIYHRFSHGASSYPLNGGNINAMLEFSIKLKQGEEHGKHLASIPLLKLILYVTVCMLVVKLKQ